MGDILTDTYRNIVENLGDGVRILDKHGRIIYANPSFCKLVGYRISELIDRPIYELYPEIERENTDCRIEEELKGERRAHEVTYRNREGREYHLKILSTPICSENNDFMGSYAILLDNTEQKNLEMTLKEEKNYFRDLTALCPDSIIGVDREGIINIFNRAAEKLLGYSAAEAIGKMHIRRIYGGMEFARRIRQLIRQPESGGEGCLEGYETQLVNRLGHHIPIRLSATLIYQEDTEIGSVGYFHDLTLAKQMEGRLRELSITDNLSGLFNHRHFYAMLNKEIQRSYRYRRVLSLICFDLDHFKECNDILGHLEGDNIIRTTGEVLKETLRKADLAFRYGGDEFMVILPETPVDSAIYTANRIREAFNIQWAYGHLDRNGGLEPVTLSMGVAELGTEETTESLIKRADLAMYEAKRSGGNRAVEAALKIGK